jgi:phosphatidylglycerol---prolipoprotein diacylglyceryl transferase
LLAWSKNKPTGLETMTALEAAQAKAGKGSKRSK